MSVIWSKNGQDSIRISSKDTILINKHILMKFGRKHKLGTTNIFLFVEEVIVYFLWQTHAKKFMTK